LIIDRQQILPFFSRLSTADFEKKDDFQAKLIDR